jgi:hypothetical protein
MANTVTPLQQHIVVISGISKKAAAIAAAMQQYNLKVEQSSSTRCG